VLVGDEPPGFVADALGGAPLPRRIAWVGRVPDETLRALYARADAFVLPSSEEGSGLPALEAMAFGAPVVCSDAASLPEVVGEAALLVPPGDPDLLAEALGRVLRDPGLAEDLRARGRARAAAFTWARAAEETVSVYRELVSHEAAWE
jgi:glycosyltransferase involved in cell wall biosynthesis